MIFLNIWLSLSTLKFLLKPTVFASQHDTLQTHKAAQNLRCIVSYGKAVKIRHNVSDYYYNHK